MKNKLCDLNEAVNGLIGDGDAVVMGTGLEVAIPFAAVHEIIRAGRKNLHLVAPISDTAGDILIGAGCLAEVSASWVGNVSAGLGHNYRRAMEGKTGLKVNDYSNLALGSALLAGAHGMPYAVVKTVLGSDILKSNPALKIAENPFSDHREPVVLVPALTPDVAVLCVQRADKAGNSHIWGSTGITQEAALAADRVIVIADEIVAADVIASDPSRVLFPGFCVAAVCHVPAGVHPSPLTGYWRRDNDFFHDYHAASRTADGYAAWLSEWVLDLPDHAAYREKLGERLDKLRIRGARPAAPANYATA